MTFLFLVAAAITVDPGAYTGRYYLDSNSNGPFSGITTQNVTPGQQHSIDLGAFGSGTGFVFDVDPAGNVSASVSATGSNSTLTFANSTVTVDPGELTGHYFLSIFDHVAETGPQGFVVVPGINYVIDDGSFAGNSAFIFNVDGSGNVTTSSPAATAAATTLSLVTYPFTIDPGSYTGKFGITATGESPLYSGKTAFSLLPLQYALDDGAFVGTSNLVFTVPAGGGTLTLANLPVVLNPGAYAGSYEVVFGGPYTGVTTVVLIPGLTTYVRVQDDVGYFTPSAAGVTPSSVTLPEATFTFTAASTPAQLVQTLLTTGQVASSGVAQSLNNAFAHATTLADYQKLQAKVDHELALGKITQQAHDALTAEIALLEASI